MGTARKAASRKGTPSSLTAELDDLVRTFRSLFDPYRPELHYMRGPGPKWHAKHRAATATAFPVAGFHVEA